MLPAVLALLIQEADQSYADWCAANDDFFREDDAATAEATMKRALNLIVTGAVGAGMDSGQAVAALRLRFPEIPVEQILDATNCGISTDDERDCDERSHRHVFCSRCGSEAVDGAIVCVKCGCRLARFHSASVDDGPNVGYAVLSFFFPIAGFVLYLVWKSDYPLRAQSCGTGAAWGFALSVVSYIVYLVAMESLLATL